jgi:hypothetical protein
LRTGFHLIRPAARIDEDADHDRDLAPVDQIVHDVLRPEVAVLVFERLTVLEHHETRRNRRIVLGGHVDPVRMLRARIDLARQRERTPDFSFGYAILRHGIGTQPVLRVRARRRLGVSLHMGKQQPGKRRR